MADQPAGLGFRVLIVPRDLYGRQIGDPFLVSERFPPNWTATGDLPDLTWPAEPPPREHGRAASADLANGRQCHLARCRAGADRRRPRGLRTRGPGAATGARPLALLPYAAQAELWPTTFAYANDLGFDLLVLPKMEGPKPDRYLIEEQVVDYPEGRYESSLQFAIEHGDQRELHRLLNRVSSRQRLRLALFILIGGTLTYLAISAISRFL